MAPLHLHIFPKQMDIVGDIFLSDDEVTTIVEHAVPSTKLTIRFDGLLELCDYWWNYVH
jgi:hypothetical protein